MEGGGEERLDQDADVARSAAVGNAAFQASIGHQRGWEGGDALLSSLAEGSRAVGIGRQVASALRLQPSPPAEHARRLAILGASELVRREELIERLQTIQSGALAVDDAVREHLGALSDAERSEWAVAFAEAPGRDAPTVAREVHAARGGEGPDAATLTALVASILARAPCLDEEEEEPIGVDYATEESGM